MLTIITFIREAHLSIPCLVGRGVFSNASCTVFQRLEKCQFCCNISVALSPLNIFNGWQVIFNDPYGHFEDQQCSTGVLTVSFRDIVIDL